MQRFTESLEGHLRSFEELRSVQREAWERVRRSDIGGLEELLGRELELSRGLMEEKARLGALMEQWRNLPGAERESLLAGRCGELLARLEEIARDIQARHEQWLASGETEPRPRQQADIMGRISWYRSFR